MGNKEAQVDWDDDGRDTEQLRAELAQAQQVARSSDWLLDNAMNVLQQERATAKEQSADLTAAVAARDALARERDEARRMVGEQREEKLELNRVQHNLQHVLDQYAAGGRALQDELTDARRVALSYLRMATEHKKKLAQARDGLKEVWAENARLATDYQDDADAICKALGVEWTGKNKYPTVAVGAIEDLLQRQAGGRAENNRWLRRHDNIAVQLAQAREELKSLQGINRKSSQQIEGLTCNRDFWFKTCRKAEKERDKALWAERQSRHEIEHELVMAEDLLRIVRQRATRAEALAQLVNEETAALLERLAWLANNYEAEDDGDAANTLAARIREALGMEGGK